MRRSASEAVLWFTESVAKTHCEIFFSRNVIPFSKRFGFVRDISKNICPLALDSDSEKYFSLVKENMNRENKIGQLIANQIGRMVTAWEKLDVRKVIIDGQALERQAVILSSWKKRPAPRNAAGLFKIYSTNLIFIPNKKFRLRKSRTWSI